MYIKGIKFLFLLRSGECFSYYLMSVMCLFPFKMLLFWRILSYYINFFLTIVLRDKKDRYHYYLHLVGDETSVIWRSVFGRTKKCEKIQKDKANILPLTLKVFFFIEIVWIFCFLHQNTLLYQFLNLFKLNKNSLSFIILKFRHLNLTKKSNY